MNAMPMSSIGKGFSWKNSTPKKTAKTISMRPRIPAIPASISFSALITVSEATTELMAKMKR